jgi:hypothetical protein
VPAEQRVDLPQPEAQAVAVHFAHVAAGPPAPVVQASDVSCAEDHRHPGRPVATEQVERVGGRRADQLVGVVHHEQGRLGGGFEGFEHGEDRVGRVGMVPGERGHAGRAGQGPHEAVTGPVGAVDGDPRRPARPSLGRVGQHRGLAAAGEAVDDPQAGMVLEQGPGEPVACQSQR